jgi:signal transduction histidine kinase
VAPVIGFALTAADLAPGWWAQRPLRTRLTVAATVLSATVIAGSAFLLVWRVQASLSTDLDVATVRQAFAVASVTTKAKRPIVPPAISGAAVVQIVGPAGNVVASSPNIDGEPRLFGFPASPASTAPSVRTIRTLPIGENGTFRATAINISTPGGSYLVYVALPTDPATRTMAILIGTLAVGVPLLVALIAFATWLFVGRALHPVELMRRQAEEITSGDLQRRLDVPPTGDELARLAATLNDMLARINASVKRQRQFVADAAHELRSPLASILAQLEVPAHSISTEHGLPDLTSEVAANTVLDEGHRLSILVDDLMALARIDAAPPLDRKIIDFDDIILTEVNALRTRTDTIIDSTQITATKVSGDGLMLGRVVRNLLDNAARHANQQVSIGLSESEGQVLLVVADDGAGIPAEDRSRIFERFTRLDSGRSRDRGGAGLGLAIVQEIVAMHHGSVHVEDNHPGARFTIRLPTVPHS